MLVLVLVLVLELVLMHGLGGAERSRGDKGRAEQRRAERSGMERSTQLKQPHTKLLDVTGSKTTALKGMHAWHGVSAKSRLKGFAFN